MSSCKDCVFFRQNPEAKMNGECRKNSPSVLTVPVTFSTPSSAKAMWPRVLTDDWCGEHTQLFRPTTDKYP